MIMKKNIFKLFSAMVVSATVLTGCIEEVFPEDSTATSDQIGASATAIEASLNGLPSQMVQGYLVYGKQTHETDLAYPSLMLAQTELLGDVVATDYGYDWWWRFNANNGMNDTGYYSYLPYFTLYKFVKSANDVIAAVDVTDPTITDEMRGLGSIAHAFRALDYYTLMVLFEPVENIYTDCSKVLGLTVPIVTEATTNDIAKSNPRATHEELVNISAKGLRIVVMFFPIVGFQMVTSNFFQSIGMASKAIFLSISRQVLVLIPCLLILPRFYGQLGVWISMPISDLIASLIAGGMLWWQFRQFRKATA